MYRALATAVSLHNNFCVHTQYSAV